MSGYKYVPKYSNGFCVSGHSHVVACTARHAQGAGSFFFMAVAGSIRSIDPTLQVLFDASPLAMVAVDLDLNVILWNASAEAMFGWSRREVLGRPYPLVPEGRQHELLDVLDHFRAGRPFEREDRIREHETGRLIDVRVSTVPLRDADGQIQGAIAFFSDITERKRAEERLRFANALLLAQQETSPDGMLVVDNAATILFWNRRFGEMWGVPSALLETLDDRLVLEHCSRIVENSAAFLERVRFLYDHPAESSREEIVLKDGRTFERYSGPMHAPDGKHCGRIWYFRDISQRKRAEQERAAFLEQIYQAQKINALGQLAGGVAHDFQNLLAVILGNVDILQTALPPHPTAAPACAMIREAAQQAMGIAHNLLAFSRRMPIEKKPVLLWSVVEDTIGILGHLLPGGVQVVAEPGSEPLWVVADAVQLKQVLINLAINARDAMPDGGTLSVSTTLRSGPDAGHAPQEGMAWACVSVRDTGHGIPESLRPHLFEPFVSTKAPGTGTGFGLAIARSIVEDHGGRIEFETELGVGTVFHVLLPCVNAEVTEELPPPSESVPVGQAQTILVAENDRFMRETIVSTLRRLNYDVVTAADGEALLHGWQSHRDRVALLVVNLDLPRKCGMECLRDVRRSAPDLPAILLAGRVEAAFEDELDDRTFLLSKPFSAGQLAILAKRILIHGCGGENTNA